MPKIKKNIPYTVYIIHTIRILNLFTYNYVYWINIRFNNVIKVVMHSQ